MLDTMQAFSSFILVELKMLMRGIRICKLNIRICLTIDTTFALLQKLLFYDIWINKQWNTSITEILSIDRFHVTHIAQTLSPLFTWIPFTRVKRIFLYLELRRHIKYETIILVEDCYASSLKHWVTKKVVVYRFPQHYIYIFFYIYSDINEV